MTLITTVAEEFALLSVDPEEHYTVSRVSWEQYKSLCSRRGDSLRYRTAYLDGTVEIGSPSRRHEFAKTNIGRLLEAYFEETRTRFWGLGSTTFRKQNEQAGREPDECYCIGTEKEFPDLAVEVVLTSGGVDRLAIYQRLGVREVWFWQNEQFAVYLLQNNEYEQAFRSELLPNLDLAMLAKYVTHSDPLEAVLEFREQVTMSIEQ